MTNLPKHTTTAERFVSGFIDKLTLALWRSGFRSTNHLAEVKLVFPLARISLGAVLLIDAFLEYWLAPSSLPAQEVAMLGMDLVASIFVLLGLLVNFAFLYLMFFSWLYVELIVGTSTLGNDIAAQLALFLFLVQAGKEISVDGLLIRTFPKIRGALLYGPTVLEGDVVIARFVGIFSFQATSWYSLAMHLKDPAWLTGAVGPLLFSDVFMSRLGSLLSQTFSDFPEVMLVFQAAMFVQLIWFATILLFSLIGGRLVLFTVIWGFGFFAGSWFVLQLGFLAPIEIIFWYLLFLPIFSRRTRELGIGVTRIQRSRPYSFVLASLVVLVFVASIPFPTNKLSNPFSRHQLFLLAAPIGVQPIDVFNAVDLRMRENWFVVRTESGFVVPIFNEDGSRAQMQILDSVYFGNTLRFARGQIDKAECGLDRHELDIRKSVQRWKRAVKLDGPVVFEVTHFQRQSPSVDAILAGKYSLKPRAEICSVRWQIN